MGEACYLRAGKAIPSDMISDAANAQRGIACFGANGHRGYVEEANFDGKAVFIGRQGALCGNVSYFDGPVYATEHAVITTPIMEIDERYLFHVLTWSNLNQYKTAGAQPGLSVKKLDTIQIPIPSLEEQKHIVATLDKFDALINDITQGIPSEIAARHQQYEYYRDKLLTFKKKAA